MGRSPVSKTQTLAFNVHWSDHDRTQVRAILEGDPNPLTYLRTLAVPEDRVDAAVRSIAMHLDHLYIVSSRAYVRGNDEAGQPLFWIRPGGIDLVVEGVDHTVLELSRAADRHPQGARHQQAPPRVCVSCGLALPVVGICDCG